MCHLDFDGHLRTRMQSPSPPGPQTRFSHPSCYLAGTDDCSERISREHYMSKSVLDQLGNTLRVTGMPWLKPDFIKMEIDNMWSAYSHGGNGSSAGCKGV
jgi:hypothetical protein